MRASPSPFDERVGGTRFPLTAFLLALLLASLAPLPALAQSVRSLGMGSVTTPASNGAGNPAFAAVPLAADGVSIPLPIGAINALLRPELDPRSDQFDVLTLFDQVNNLTTFVVNPASSPDEVVISVAQVNGVPTVSLDLVGGAPLQITNGVPVGYGQDLQIPISFDLGTFSLGVRPYLEAHARLTPQANFGDLFAGGTTSGSVDALLRAEGGVGVNATFATGVELPADVAFPGALYVGARAEPFIGLLKVDGTGDFNVSAQQNSSGEAEFAYSYQGDGFYAVVGQGGIGYGVTGDFGVAIQLPLAQGNVVAGLGVTDLGLAVWNGREVTASGDSTGTSTQTGPTAASRTYFADRFGVNANAAFEPELSLLGIDGLESLLIAADAGYEDRLLSGHLGAEAGFAAGTTTLLARAGLGYDEGLVLGVGGGVRLAGIGVDGALHSYRSPLTAHQAFGATLGLSFGF